MKNEKTNLELNLSKWEKKGEKMPMSEEQLLSQKAKSINAELVVLPELNRNHLYIFSDTCDCCGNSPYYLFTDNRLYVYNKRLNQLYYRNKRGKHYIKDFKKIVEKNPYGENRILIVIPKAYTTDRVIAVAVDSRLIPATIGTLTIDDSHGYCHPNKIVLHHYLSSEDVIDIDLYESTKPSKIIINGKLLSYSTKFNELILK